MPELKPTIAALRTWLKTCPLIADEQEITGAAFRIAGLDEETTAFSIEDSPGDPVLNEYFPAGYGKEFSLSQPPGVQRDGRCCHPEQRLF